MAPTVIPALIDAHQHIGMTDVTAGTTSQDNYTRDNIIDHLERSAYHGIAATMSLGLEVNEALALGLRNELFPNAARFLTSGRGIAATPMAGPQATYRLGIPRGALSEAEGRAAVRKLRANEIDLVKIWVDDRGGTVPKIEPEVYRVIIDEAHASGMRVVAHVGTTSALEDAKGLLRAGIDGFAHTVRDRDIDDEYLTLVQQHPDVWTIPNLPGSSVTLGDLPWLSETLPPFEIEGLRRQAERLEEEGPNDLFQLQCRNLARNHEAGMAIGMGTDSGTSVAWTAHTELRDMVTCGLSPHEAIVAATRTNGGDPWARRPRNRGAGQERVFRGAGRGPDRGHHEYPLDSSRLSPGRGGGSTGARREIQERCDVRRPKPKRRGPVHAERCGRTGPRRARVRVRQFASGFGLTWNLTIVGRWTPVHLPFSYCMPSSECQTVSWALPEKTPRPFQPASGSSIRPSTPRGK